MNSCFGNESSSKSNVKKLKGRYVGRLLKNRLKPGARKV